MLKMKGKGVFIIWIELVAFFLDLINFMVLYKLK
jgi:hypothetical protein